MFSIHQCQAHWHLGWINNLLKIPNPCSAPNWWRDWESVQVPISLQKVSSDVELLAPNPSQSWLQNISAWFVSKWAWKNYQEAVAKRNQALLAVSITPHRQVCAFLLPSCHAKVVTKFPISLAFIDRKACYTWQCQKFQVHEKFSP